MQKSKHDLRNVITLILLGLVLTQPVGVLAVSPQHPPAQPNIVFILADDLGIVDVNAYAARFTGAKPPEMFYETPHLDRLVRGGLAFSQAYASQLCSPTRASLLTGRNAARLGFTTATPHTARSWHSRDLKPPPGYLAQDAVYWGDPLTTPQALLNGSTLLALPSGQSDDQGRDELTFAEALPEYRSVFLGKWHVGGHGARGYQPQDQGFEPISWFDAGGSPYFNWRALWNRTAKHYPEMPQAELAWGRAGETAGQEYLTDELTAQAVRFLRSHHAGQNQQPFLLYLCHFAVHTPIQAKPNDVAHFEGKASRGWNNHQDPIYAAMIKSLDDSVGRILAALEELQLIRNTLVVFMSDNGGISWVTRAEASPITSNAPFKGGKAMLYEGGVRVPLVFYWPGRIPGGQWCDVPVDSSDLFPTLLEVAGHDVRPHYEPRGIDGRSLVPLFTDVRNLRQGYSRDTFYWHYPLNVAPLHPDDDLPLTPHSAIRRGDHKLIFDWHGPWYLHNLRDDPFETNNLAAARPELARELFVQLHDWLDANIAVKYMPALNPDYDPAQEVRARPFEDLRRIHLGDARAIRSADSDPRLRQLLPARPPRMMFGDTSRLGRPLAKDPSVIRWGGRYLMYFSLPPFAKERAPAGAPRGWSIGIAESHDLVNWNTIGELLPEQECDQNGLCAPGARILDGQVHLFYQTYGNGPRDAICHAVSDDGVNFRRNPSNPVFRPTGGWNNGRAIDAEAFPDGERLLLYFATRDPTGRTQMLGVASAPLKSDFSRDTWRQLSDAPILRPELPWETRCIEAASIIRRGDRLVMFYAGGYNNDPQQVGVATSRDGVSWTRLFNEPLLPNGAPGEWNASESGHPGIFEDDDGRTYLFFQGNKDKGRTWFLSRVEIGWHGHRPVVLGAARPPPSSSPAPGLVAREGRFFKDGKPYRGVGANYYDLFGRVQRDPTNTTSLRGLEQLAGAGIPFVRFAVGAFHARDWKLYLDQPEEYFHRLDLVVRTAEQAGIGLIPSLFWTPAPSELVGEPRDQWGNPESQTHALMRRFTSEVVRRYRDSPAIWAWEFGNEMNLKVDLPNAAQHRKPGGTERDDLTSAHLVVMLTEFGREVRRHDPHRALLSGNSRPRPAAWHNTHAGTWQPDSRDQTRETLRRDNPPPLDAISVHVYDGDNPAKDLAAWATNRLDYLCALKEFARADGRPLFVGEFGVPRDAKGATSRANLEQMLDDLEAAAVDLAAFWVFDLAMQEKDWNVTFTNDRAWIIELMADTNRLWRAAAAREERH
jgi:arylsulfatase A-like enzyme